MSFDFRFKTIEDEKELKLLLNFLIKQDLGYPNYEEWVQKSEYEIEKGLKIPILGLSGNELVADLIYQKHKELSNSLEIKNCRVISPLRYRDFARFMFKQVEIEAKRKYDSIVCDVRSTEIRTIEFLLNINYIPLNKKPLYDNKLDIIFFKSLEQRS